MKDLLDSYSWKCPTVLKEQLRSFFNIPLGSAGLVGLMSDTHRHWSRPFKGHRIFYMYFK